MLLNLVPALSHLFVDLYLVAWLPLLTRKKNLGTFFITTALSAEVTDVQANYNDMQLFRETISLIMFPLSKRSLNYLLEETLSIL